MNSDEELYGKAVERISRAILVIGAGGALGALWWGWRAAAAFALGSAVSWLSFRWLRQAVDTLKPDAPPPPKRLVVFVALRYLMFGATAYVIVKVFGMNGIGAACSLFVPVSAVMWEIFYELIHDRT